MDQACVETDGTGPTPALDGHHPEQGHTNLAGTRVGARGRSRAAAHPEDSFRGSEVASFL